MFSNKYITLGVIAGAIADFLLLDGRLPSLRSLFSSSPNQQLEQHPVVPPSGLIIGWCTATGTAKRFALLTASDAAEHRINVLSCSCVSEIQLASLLVPPPPSFFVLLFVATQGDGDTPGSFDSFKRNFEADLWSVAKKSRCSGFHVVGLGDSSYRHFCDAGKQAAAWLAELLPEVSKQTSALTIVDARLGANAAEELVESEMGKLLSSLQSRAADGESFTTSSSSSSSSSSPLTLASPIHCSFSDKPPRRSPFPVLSSIQPTTAERPIELRIVKCETLSSIADGAARDVVRVAFDAFPLTSRSMIQPGDHLALYPTNSIALARRCAKALGHEANLSATLSVTSSVTADNRASPREVLPASVTLFEALRRYPDLSGPPRKRLISKVLSVCCRTDEERERVRGVIASQGGYCTAVHVLEAAPRPLPLDDFFFICPRLLPRFFSISDVWEEESEEEEQPQHRLSLMVALLKHGCFSEMVLRCCRGGDESGEQFFAFLRHTNFHPTWMKAPVILIGAGTGVAPFIGFLREMQRAVAAKRNKIKIKNKQQQQQQQQQRDVRSEVALFYGFTTVGVGSPFLYELRALRDSGVLSFLEEAESRPISSNSPQRVQQRVAAAAPRLRDWIVERGASIFVCGRSAMARGVEEAIVKSVLIGAAGMSEDGAQRFVQQQLQNHQRLRLDCWEA